MNVYCITGYPGSGKSTATEYIRGKRPVIVMGDIVRRLAKEKSNISEDNGREIGEWATEQREENGQTVFAEETCEIIQREYKTSEKIVIDGIRSVQELEVFENEFDTVTIIYIHTPFDMRYERITERGRDSEEKDYTKKTLRERDAQEENWGLDGIINRADVQINNTDSLQSLYTELDDILQL